MSTTLFFLVPIGMLAVVWSLCFVGACFPTSGLPEAYSNIILQEPSLIAYWPLSDFANSPLPPSFPPPPQNSTSLGAAADLSGNGHIGSYLIPPAYPTGSTIIQVANPTPNTGLNLHQTSIVPGDGVVSGSKNLPACVDFEGGYVGIPWAANSPQLNDFTFEAWIKPSWTAPESASGAFLWVVFSAFINNTGIRIFVNGQNQWQFTVGTGGTSPTTAANTMVPVTLNSTTYVAVTFESATTTLSLWIDPDSDDPSTPPTAMWTSNSTGYAAVDPTTQPLTFFIGAGANDQPPRTQPMGAGAPLDPFKGLIQSVALYKTALNPTDLASHFASGASSDTDS
ncbi:MAG: LamG domain-containing protein [Steroidobacteraceae bacterium]